MRSGPILQLVVNNDASSDARVQRTGRAAVAAGYPVVYVGATDEPSRRILRWLEPASPAGGIERRLVHRGAPLAYDTLLARVNAGNPLLKDKERISDSIRAALTDDSHSLGDRIRTLARAPQYAGLFAINRSGVLFRARRVARWPRWLGAARELLRLQPRLIHAHDLDSFRWIVPHARLAKIPVIYDAHELERGRNIPRWTARQRKMHALTERLSIGYATDVITVAPSIAQLLAETYEIEEPTVIVNAPPRTAVRDNTPVAERLGLAPDAKVILYLGGVTFGRGIEELFAVLKRLPKNVHTVLIGPINQQYAPHFERLTADPELRRRVHVRPPVPYEDVVHEARGADIGFCGVEDVCESYRHALPNKFFEYVFADVPVVSTPSFSTAPLIDEYSLGAVYPYGDLDALEGILRRALLEAPLEIPPDQRAKFIDRFCAESQSHKLAEVYARALAAS